MYGFVKFPINKLWKQEAVDSTNPFDSDNESEKGLNPGRNIASKPVLRNSGSGNNPFDDDTYRTPISRAFRDMFKNSFRDLGEKVMKQKSVDATNPFDSDNEYETKGVLHTRGTTASPKPVLVTPASATKALDDDNHGKETSLVAWKDRYKNGFRDTGGIQSQAVEELENYVVYKATETTKTVNSSLKIAEDIREGGRRTLEMLHQQGQHMRATHLMAVEVDRDLSRGEKLLNSLGGVFSKSWKPKKTRDIAGPLITSEFRSKTSENHVEQRENLGLSPARKARYGNRGIPPEPTNALQKVEVEEAKQDDALSDLSNILGDLKSMAIDMGSELSQQNKALYHLHDDVDELNSRVKGANQRARHLLGK